jgi:hypothetical protein
MRFIMYFQWVKQRDPNLGFCSLLLVCLLSVGIGLQAQEGTVPPPGNMRLLPGYYHERLQGIDSIVGRIWKENGPSIFYDMGYGMSAEEFKASVPCVWYKEQVTNGKTVQLVLSKERVLYGFFPHDRTSFQGKVTSEEELVEVLLMLLTYPPCESTQ